MKGKKLGFLTAAVEVLGSLSLAVPAEDPETASSKELETLAGEVKAAYLSGDIEKVITHLEHMLELLPSNANLEYSLASAYAATGRKQAALSRRKTQESNTTPKPIFHKAKSAKNGRADPLLVFLHGMGSSPQDVEEGLLFLTDRYSLLLPCGNVRLGTRADGRTGYTWDPDTDVERILKTIKGLEGIAPGRVYLSGFSAGVSVCYLLAFEELDTFADVVAFSGSLPMKSISREEWKAASKKVPVFIVHGTKDQAMPFSVAENNHEFLKAFGFRVTLRTFQGGHSAPKNFADLLREAIAWLGSSRGKDR